MTIIDKNSLAKDKIKILLLEGLHPSSLEELTLKGYSNIESLKTSLSESELIEKIADVHFIGIRSRTQLTDKVLSHANKLVAHLLVKLFKHFVAKPTAAVRLVCI